MNLQNSNDQTCIVVFLSGLCEHIRVFSSLISFELSTLVVVCVSRFWECKQPLDYSDFVALSLFLPSTSGLKSFD